MTHSFLNIMMAIYGLILVVLAGFAIALKRRDNNYKSEDKVRTKGTVVKYSVNDSRAPVVEYTVNGVNYRKALKYSYVKSVSTPFHRVNTEVKTDLLDTVLRLRGNSMVSVNTVMRDHFPIGSSLNVYYDETRPQVAYVERYARSYVPLILTVAAVLTAVAMLITYLVFV
ncbi:hypothetical protein G7061_04940 [Erysipelothrix sp. HDW6B]|uniref:DUF3592 domain-containing protein n=1 Tax=Erysipelothrix TaxID=1647 RepID=UPI00135B399C|nr:MULTISPECIES: DUF3592 domain-containing protein [Erysipelothrix]QIK85986.1 hypothetical protein G7061_04940 [Erysipelothrix sp. HDW6B]